MKKIDFLKIGFDYGIKPELFLLADIQFVELFQKAKCPALLYGFDDDSSDNITPCSLGFLFEEQKYADLFFDSLLSWVTKSNNNGDAVILDFLETNDGGYVLAISQDIKTFIDYMVPKTHIDKVCPIAIMSIQFKVFPKFKKNYLKFKNNISNTKEVTIEYYIGDPNTPPKKSAKSFKKTIFNFYTEDNIPENSVFSGYNPINKTIDFKKESQDKQILLEEIENRREIELKFYFPILYNKIKNGWLTTTIEDLETNNKTSEIIQAICNITLIERLKRDSNNSLIKQNNNQSITILSYLLSTYESFDSYFPQAKFYSKGKILQQIKKDKKELTQYQKKIK